jgi:hypothetical protein
LRPSSKCDGLSIVVFLQQPCLQYGDKKGEMLFDFQQAGGRRAASSTMYCAVTRDMAPVRCRISKCCNLRSPGVHTGAILGS